MGVVIDDLEAATAFFLDPGHECEGGGPIEGEWMDKVVGLDDVRADLDEKGACPAPANRLGIRHIAFVVHDLDTIVNGLRAKGLDLTCRWSAEHAADFGPYEDGGLR